MQSDSVVIAFDVTEDFRSGIFNRFKNAVFDQFRLKAREKTFCLGVVITVSFPRHRLAEPADVQQAAIFNRRVLAALIGVNNRVFADQSAPSRLQENINDRLRRHPLRYFPPDDAPRVFVLSGTPNNKTRRPEAADK